MSPSKVGVPESFNWKFKLWCVISSYLNLFYELVWSFNRNACWKACLSYFELSQNIFKKETIYNLKEGEREIGFCQWMNALNILYCIRISYVIVPYSLNESIQFQWKWANYFLFGKYGIYHLPYNANLSVIIDYFILVQLENKFYFLKNQMDATKQIK